MLDHASDKEEMAKILRQNNIDKLHGLKQRVRNSFVNGPICDYTGFTDEFENKLIEIYKSHKW